jgi:hypothetical protein
MQELWTIVRHVAARTEAGCRGEASQKGGSFPFLVFGLFTVMNVAPSFLAVEENNC